MTYIDSKYITFGAGLGFSGFSQQEGIHGDMGFGFRLSAGHHFNRYLQGEIVYEFSTFRFESPDPVNPAQSLDTRAAMNKEIIRAVFTYPMVLAQPFVSAGIGGYNFFDVNEETALSFPFNVTIPLAAGVRSYIYKNLLSLDLEFNYYFLIGENPSASTLALLNLQRIKFDAYSFMGTFTFHFF